MYDNKKYKNDMIIFIASPDSYQDVFSVFLNCYNRFSIDCPYEFVLSTNSVKEYEGITVYSNYKTNDTWMDRTIPVLNEINSDYIMLLCDDLMITEDINWEDIEAVLEIIKKHHINFCGLTNFIDGKAVEENCPLRYVKKNKPYARNLQAGIFNRKYLLSVLNYNKTAWDVEEDWLHEAVNAPNEYFNDVVSCQSDLLHCYNSVSKGKWRRACLKKLNRLGISVDLKKREVLPRWTEFRLMLFSRLGYLVPTRLRPIVKKAAVKFGYTFTSKY